ncbi:FAD dependent oxidoreductase [Sporotomaculum syntrophicum]|uniref:FAD dependent oxidoreductase n=1 Tax=Sporotomaculum syntrophicum TaxID=182264 RepID=A0A9D3AWY8_9FIRM|nr:FAD-dependent oxidoreductase [Sporotomaculum syntrophicum]KAF1086065.1 FAD dependent oxidoreductase [Sporotomaculum syntrophicum]
MKRHILWAVLLITAVTGLYFLLDRRPEPAPMVPTPPDAPAARDRHYDLIVVGSDPEGVAAAVSGARNGLATLLVDTRPVLGGLMTRGWLNTIDMNYAPGGGILNKGIFLEFFEQVEGDSFDVGTALKVFNQLVENEPNIHVLLGAATIKPVVAPNTAGKSQVTGILVTEQGGGERPFNANIVIDATQDADLAALAGAAYSFGQSDMGYETRNMAVTPVFQLKGVSRLDWLKLGFNLALQRITGTHYVGINMVSAWGFGEVMSKYRPSNEQVGIRGLNIGRQKDGTVLVNALHVYNINPLDKEQLASARVLAEQELPLIVEYFREHIPGFAHAELVALAPEFYVRESRHIYGEYRLTVDDVLENRDFPDTIACGSYPIDIQALDPNFKGAIVGVPKQYGIPLRALIPQNINGLMVVGRAASFDSLAHGSARVLPVGMAAGQAAGVAAALSIDKGVPVSELSKHKVYLTELRQRLNQQGMELKPFQYQAPETKHWAYPGLKLVRSYGLVFGGYENEYDLDEEMSEAKFINLLHWLTKLTAVDIKPPLLYTEGNALTLQDISYMLLQYLDQKNLTKEQAYQFLLKQDFFDNQVLEQIKENNGIITNGTAYMILKSYVEKRKVLKVQPLASCKKTGNTDVCSP